MNKQLGTIVILSVSSFLSVALMSGSKASAAATKIGYVDIQRAIQATSAGKNAK